MTPTPDFNHFKRLWILKSVLESGGLSQAAVANKVTVSAISQSLTNLEESLGRKILVRRDRKIQPTPYCLDLLKSAEPVFTALSLMNAERKETCVIPPMSWLNFGVSEHLACQVLPPFMASMKDKLPKMKLKLQVDTCDSLIKAVKRGDLCMAVVTDPGSVAGVNSYDIAADQLGLFISVSAVVPGAVAAAGKSRTPVTRAAGRGRAALPVEAPERLPVAVLRAPKTGYPAYYSRFLRRIAASTQTIVTCESTEVLYSVARSGAAAAVLPSRLAQRESGLLREVRMTPPQSHSIIMVSEKICDPLEDEFLIAELKTIFGYDLRSGASCFFAAPRALVM